MRSVVFILASVLPLSLALFANLTFSFLGFGLLFCFGIPFLVLYLLLLYGYAHVFLAPQIALIEQIGPLTALRRSWTLARSQSRRLFILVFAIQILFFLLVSLPSYLSWLLLPYTIVPDRTTINMALRIYAACIPLLTMPLANIISIIIYDDLRYQVDGV